VRFSASTQVLKAFGLAPLTEGSGHRKINAAAMDNLFELAEDPQAPLDDLLDLEQPDLVNELANSLRQEGFFPAPPADEEAKEDEAAEPQPQGATLSDVLAAISDLAAKVQDNQYRLAQMEARVDTPAQRGAAASQGDVARIMAAFGALPDRPAKPSAAASSSRGKKLASPDDDEEEDPAPATASALDFVAVVAKVVSRHGSAASWYGNYLRGQGVSVNLHKSQQYELSSLVSMYDLTAAGKSPLREICRRIFQLDALARGDAQLAAVCEEGNEFVENLPDDLLKNLKNKMSFFAAAKAKKLPSASDSGPPSFPRATGQSVLAAASASAGANKRRADKRSSAGDAAVQPVPPAASP
jgi:hypothetical protein